MLKTTTIHSPFLTRVFLRTTSCLLCWIGCVGSLQMVVAQDEAAPLVAQALDADQLLQQQTILAGQFNQLETKLFDLYQMERDSRPQRAELLRQMYELAQQKNTTGRFNEIVQLIKTKQLRLAQQAQVDALSDLKSMMEILQKEDESQRLRDEKKRQQENLREIKRLLQKQIHLRGDTLQSDDPASLTEQQQTLADETEWLQSKMENQNSNSESGDEKKSDGQMKPPNDKKLQENDPSGQDPPDQNPSGNEDDHPKAEDRTENNDSELEKSDVESDGPSADPSSQDPTGDQDDSGSGEDSLSKRIKAAQQKMQKAQEALKQAQKDPATDRMTEAIEQLESAKKELEAILKQSREEEMMSTLARLEDQFRQMLEVQLRVNQKTLQMEQVPTNVRGPDHEIGAAQLAGQQRKNAMSALRAAMILRDDASSVALAVTVEQMNDDMTTVADRLVVADTGSLTQQFENDIVETLELLIASVVKAQEDVQKQAQQSPPQNSQPANPGEMPLVDQIAELKMLKGLQERILKRHQVVAKRWNADQLTLGELSNVDATTMLKKLEQQQARLFEMTREMVKQIK